MSFSFGGGGGGGGDSACGECVSGVGGRVPCGVVCCIICWDLELISWWCFGWLRGVSGLGGVACRSLWWCRPFMSYGALKAQKSADITTCQQFSAVLGLLGGLCCCDGVHVVLLGFGGSFRWCGPFF